MRWFSFAAALVSCTLVLTDARGDDAVSAEFTQQTTFPVVCPQFELYQTGPDEYLYYAYRYESSCGDTPVEDFIVGNHSTPASCPGDCESPSGVNLSQSAFRGLPNKVSLDYVHALPDSPSTLSRSHLLQDPECQFIRYIDDESGFPQAVTAKVFAVHLQQRCGNCEPRLMFFAVECEGVAPGVAAVPAKRAPLAGNTSVGIDHATVVHPRNLKEIRVWILRAERPSALVASVPIR